MRDAELDAAVMAYKCGQCGADVGEWCRTTSGRRSVRLHSSRGHKARWDIDKILERRLAS